MSVGRGCGEVDCSFICFLSLRLLLVGLYCVLLVRSAVGIVVGYLWFGSNCRVRGLTGTYDQLVEGCFQYVVIRGSVLVVGSIWLWTGWYMFVGEGGWKQGNLVLYYTSLAGRVLCHQRKLLGGELVVRAGL